MKSLSNMIKAYTVRYDEDTKKTIDTHLRIEKEIEIRRSQSIKEIPSQDPFVEGLKAIVIDEVPSQAESSEKSAKLLEEANYEAKKIIEQAKSEAETLKKEAFSEGQKKGYEEGLLKGRNEVQKLKDDYAEKNKSLQEEYDKMVLALEPQMADIIASLVEKITGILVEDREEVLLYLVDKALKSMEKSNEYTIRVSKENYELIEMRKNLLMNAISREVPLYIVEDTGLSLNQCLIETETRVINCSLDIQLKNLITDLKLIGGI